MRIEINFFIRIDMRYQNPLRHRFLRKCRLSLSEVAQRCLILWSLALSLNVEYKRPFKTNRVPIHIF